MKSRFVHGMICGTAAMFIAAAALAQDSGGESQAPQVTGALQTVNAQPQSSEAGPQTIATTRPANTEEPTSRPVQMSRSDYRNQRRNERRMQQQQGRETGFGSTTTPLSELVGSRNIFVRGNQTMPVSVGNSGGQSSAQAQEQLERSAEAQLVLTGVSLADNGKTALIENHSDYSVQQVKVGDAIAFGKVVNMTLDSLDYQNKAGKIIRVQIGDNLSGGDVEGVVGSGPGASTQPSKAGPRMPGESMEDYMKRRRSAELSH
jgi:hypothetical protein